MKIESASRLPHIMAAIVSSVSFVLCAGSVRAAEPTAEDVAFRASVDDSEQRYVRVLPADFDAAASHDLLITLHGHGSDRWQYVKQPRDECRAARDIAAKHRMILISPDYRATTSWMGPKAEADLAQIIRATKARYKIRHVIVSGASMGGTSCLIFAAQQPELTSAVVSINGTANMLEYENFQDAVRASYGGTKTEVPEEYKRRSPELRPERLTMPIAFATGGLDRSVPPASVLRLVEALKKLERPVLSIHRPSGGHSTNYADTTEAYEFVIGKLANPAK